MVDRQNEYTPDYVSPPGETLQEIMDDRDITQVDLAKRIGMTRKHLRQILKGKAPVTPETALCLERVLGVPAHFWNNREQHYRDFLARQAEQRRLEKNKQWVRNFTYYKKMADFGWVDSCNTPLDRARALLNFFGVASPEAWQTKWAVMPVQYRKSKKYQADVYALAAWLRQGEIQAQQIECEPYCEKRFHVALREMRRLTVEPPEEFQPRLVKGCAQCGVAVVFVPELPKTASGATRWLAPDKALIQLSLKYKTDDHLWFTFFHEAGHILRHSKKTIFLEGRKYDSREEEQANAFAARTLIPRDAFQRLIAAGRPTLDQVKALAHAQGIAPGIVVGQLQHHRIFEFNQGNDLKRSFEWALPENV